MSSSIPTKQLHSNYMAFISYRHADNKDPDAQWASWLHNKLETYEIPPDLVGSTNDRGDVIPDKIYPVFRDEESLPAHHSLPHSIAYALDHSNFLVVLCSPGAVESRYVAEEIEYFKRAGHSDRIISALLVGEPNASRDEAKQVDPDKPETQECFPRPLQYDLNETGDLDPTLPTEPIAADFRFLNGQRGVTNRKAHKHLLAQAGLNKEESESELNRYERQIETAFLKIVAGILGVTPETLRDRHDINARKKARAEQRRTRRNLVIVSVLLVLVIGAGFLAYDQNQLAVSRLTEVREQTQMAETATADAKRKADALAVQEEYSKELINKQLTKAETIFGEGLDFPPVIEHIVNGNLFDVQQEVSAGVDVNMQWDGGKSTPLIAAIAANQLSIAKWLVNKGANVNLVTDNETTALMETINYNRLSIADWLLNQGAEVNYLNNRGLTAVSLAASQAKPEFIKLLIENGADVNRYLPEKFTTPLYASINPDIKVSTKSNQLQAVQQLIDAGANIEYEMEMGPGNTQLTSIFMSINPRKTPLHKDIVLILLKAGGDPDTNLSENTIVKYSTARYFNAQSGDLETLQQYFDDYSRTGKEASPKALNLMLIGLSESLTQNYQDYFEYNRTYSKKYSADDYLNIIDQALTLGASPYATVKENSDSAFGRLISSITFMSEPDEYTKTPDERYVNFLKEVFVNNIEIYLSQAGFEHWKRTREGSIKLSVCNDHCPEEVKAVFLKHNIDLSDIDIIL